MLRRPCICSYRPPPRKVSPPPASLDYLAAFKLARQFTDSGGFTHAVHANHQNNKRRLPFNKVRLPRQNLAHPSFNRPYSASASFVASAAGAFRQISDNLTRGFYPDISDEQATALPAPRTNHRRFFCRGTDRINPKPRFSFAFADCVSGGQRNLFSRFFLFLNDQAPLLASQAEQPSPPLPPPPSGQRLRFQLFVGEFRRVSPSSSTAAMTSTVSASPATLPARSAFVLTSSAAATPRVPPRSAALPSSMAAAAPASTGCGFFALLNFLSNVHHPSGSVCFALLCAGVCASMSGCHFNRAQPVVAPQQSAAPRSVPASFYHRSPTSKKKPRFSVLPSATTNSSRRYIHGSQKNDEIVHHLT